MKSQLSVLASAVALFLLVGCNATGVTGDETIGTQEMAIVGGTNADIANHPWQVLLWNKANGMPICGGVILSERWILTAQHCVYETPPPNNNHVLRSPSSFGIAAGASSLTAMATLGQLRDVEEIIRYPGYVQGTGGTKGKDVALIRLATPLALGAKVQPIAMATPADEAAGLTSPGVIARVSGWGALLHGPGEEPSNTLQVVDVPIVSNAAAQMLYWNETITADQLAAGDLWNGGEDACQGDSGGPLTVAKGSGRILAGVTSWGSGCAEPQHPGMYARVAAFRSWISSVMASSPVVLDQWSGLSGSEAQWWDLVRYVPAGTATLNVHSFGGTGAALLYVRQGSSPTPTDYDCVSNQYYYNNNSGGNNQSCSFDNPAPGLWYFSLFGQHPNYSGVTVKATIHTPNGQTWLTEGDGKALTGDFNGDGRSDWMRWSSSPQGWHVCLSNGTNAFTNCSNWLGMGDGHAATGDFNGDGRSDWMRWDGSPYGWTVCLSNGTNAFTNCSTWLGMGDGNAVTGDFNGDGRSDWMRWDNSPLGWTVCLSNGTNAFTNCRNWLPGMGNGNVVTGDFNGDGRSDWMRWDNSPLGWTVCLSNGTNAFTSCSNWLPGMADGHVLAGDFNDDGRSDWARWNSSALGWHVCLSNGTNAFTNCNNWLPGVPDGNAIAGDFNGDGRTDLSVFEPTHSWKTWLR